MAILTPARLKSLSSRPALANSWHFVSAAVLSVCNYPQEVPLLYKHAIAGADPTDHARITSQCREALLKSAALIGLPRTINSLTALKEATPEHLRPTEVLRKQKESYAEDGAALWDKVYGKISRRIHYQLHTAYPDLDWFVLRHEYGPLLAFTDVLSAKETSLVIVASLVPQDVNPQLKGHLRGAINQGATKEEVAATRELAIEIARWCGIEWKSEVSSL